MVARLLFNEAVTPVGRFDADTLIVAEQIELTVYSTGTIAVVAETV